MKPLVQCVLIVLAFIAGVISEQHSADHNVMVTTSNCGVVKDARAVGSNARSYDLSQWADKKPNEPGWLMIPVFDPVTGKQRGDELLLTASETKELSSIELNTNLDICRWEMRGEGGGSFIYLRTP